MKICLLPEKKYAKKGKPLSHQVWRNVDTALSSTRKLIRSANRSKKKIHVLHITTAEEIKLLLKNRKYVSFEVTPQHLILASPDCYKKLGNYAQMNPPIRGIRHRKRLPVRGQRTKTNARTRKGPRKPIRR